ncbi:hypothetical protein ColKHC_14285 [Colletotrichum higginsianum]|nr:hypothetical protein ColKHC_14285 [Colletotrichum higginsianum]
MPRLPDMAGVIKQADQIVQDIAEFLLGGGSSSSSLLVPQIPSALEKHLQEHFRATRRLISQFQDLKVEARETSKKGWGAGCSARLILAPGLKARLQDSVELVEGIRRVALEVKEMVFRLQ